MLTTLSKYAQKSYISCAKPSQDGHNLAKMPVLPDFLPQPANFFARIYSLYPRHFATLKLGGLKEYNDFNNVTLADEDEHR